MVCITKLLRELTKNKVKAVRKITLKYCLNCVQYEATAHLSLLVEGAIIPTYIIYIYAHSVFHFSITDQSCLHAICDFMI